MSSIHLLWFGAAVSIFLSHHESRATFYFSCHMTYLFICLTNQASSDRSIVLSSGSRFSLYLGFIHLSWNFLSKGFLTWTAMNITVNKIDIWQVIYHYSYDHITIVWSLWRHPQSVMMSSAECKPSEWDTGDVWRSSFLLSFRDTLCRVRNKIMYALSSVIWCYSLVAVKLRK